MRQTIAEPESRQLIEPCRKRRRTGVEASHHGKRLTTAVARECRATEPMDPRLEQTSVPRSSLHAAAASGVRNCGEVVAAPAWAINAAPKAAARRQTIRTRGRRM